jgi:hypothetical protein
MSGPTVTAIAVGAGIGAAVGGVSAAISGGDIGMGILGGAVGGGLTGGLAGPIGGMVGGEMGGTFGGLAAGAIGGVANSAITGGDPLMGGLMGGAMGGLAGGMGSYDSAMNEWNQWMASPTETGSIGSGLAEGAGGGLSAAEGMSNASGASMSDIQPQYLGGSPNAQGPTPSGMALGTDLATYGVTPSPASVTAAELAGSVSPQFGPEMPTSMAQGGLDMTGRVPVYDPNLMGPALKNPAQQAMQSGQDWMAQRGIGQGTMGQPAAAYGPAGNPTSAAGSIANVAKPSLMSDPIGWVKANPLPAAAGGLTIMSMLGGSPQQPQAMPATASQPLNSSFNQPLQKYTWTGGTPTQRAFTPAPAGYNAGRQGEWTYFPYSSQMTPMKAGGKVGGKKPAGGLGQARAIHGGQDDVVPILGAKGEYMIPADVVSHLGDGHTDAGAAKLDGMVKNVRKSKGARPSLPPRSRPNPLSYVARSA